MQPNLKLKGRIYGTFGNQIIFAYKMGEDPSYVSKVINGWRTPGPEKKELWAKALGCEINDIFIPEGDRRIHTHEG